MTVYPVGYNGQTAELALIEATHSFQMLDPEFGRRLSGLLVYGAGRLGFGQGWRSSVLQEAEFLRRHHADRNGSISWNGQRWSLNAGAAPLAPPGSSYHESTTREGLALAADLIGDLTVLHDFGALFGLIDFTNVGNEPWHCQPVELPHARSNYRASMHPLPRFPTPEDTDMTAATLWRHPDFLNVFLVGAGPALNVSPALFDSLTARGIPTIIEEHAQLLKGCLTQSGLTLADLVPAAQ